MTRVASWAATLVVSLAALVGLIALLNSRDKSGVDQQAAVTAGPGKPYRGEPALSPALKDALKLGNVVVLYRDPSPPAGTPSLVPPGGKALEAAGQAVLVDRQPTLATPLAAVAATRIQEADAPGQLRPFIDYWLGGR
jgi:hypothetical protein